MKLNLAKIIEVCAKNNVKCIKFEGTEIEFFGGDTKEQVYLTPIEEDDKNSFIEEDKIQEVMEEFDTLMIEDPARYEELLVNGKLAQLGEPDAES